jgi:hypothetical protein
LHEGDDLEIGPKPPWVPLPSPLKILVFMRIEEFFAQNPLGVGVTGKILLIKELGVDFSGWTKNLARMRQKRRERTGPVTGRSTYEDGL